MAQPRRNTLARITGQAERLRSNAKLFVAEVSSARTAPKLSLGLSQPMLRVSWVIVLFFHVLNGVYAGVLALVYLLVYQPVMHFYVKLLGMMPQENYRWVIVLYGVIAAANFFSALQMTFYSLYHRRLVFRKMSVDADKAPNITAYGMIKRFLQGLTRTIGVRGQWFDVMLIMRETTEIASQTVQAHYSSFLISNVQINLLFAGLIFLNTIANSFVYSTVKDRVGLRRLYCTTIDLTLDFVYGLVMPGRIVFVYIIMFFDNNQSFPVGFAYSDTLIIKAILDCNQFFMVSWLDAVTTTLPYLNMLSGLRSIKLLIEHDMKMIPTSFTSFGRKVQPSSTSSPAVTSELQLGTIFPEERVVEHYARHIGRKSWVKRFTRMLKILMPLCGLFVLMTSITASGVFFGDNDICPLGCKLQMHPWLISRCACSVMEIDCYQRGIVGLKNETRAILQEIDTTVLNSLIIAHCPALVITADIRRFSNLIVLELYNTTIVEWPSSASLSLPYLPRLGSVYIVRSHLHGGIPEGLTTNLAPNVVDIEIVASDFGSMIPDDLGKKWASVMVLYIEHSGIQKFPRMLEGMKLTDLSLVNNNISVIPSDLILDDGLQHLMLDRNPIGYLPNTLGVVKGLRSLSFQYTNVALMPVWVTHLQTHGPKIDIFAFGTPYCTSASSNRDKETYVNCAIDKTDRGSDGAFPLAMKDGLRVIAGN